MLSLRIPKFSRPTQNPGCWNWENLKGEGWFFEIPQTATDTAFRNAQHKEFP